MRSARFPQTVRRIARAICCARLVIAERVGMAPLSLFELLPDDLVDAIVSVAIESVAFFAVTCRQIRKSERRVRTGTRRRCAIECAFRTTATLKEALLSTSFCKIARLRLAARVRWTDAALNAALRVGDSAVVQEVSPNLVKIRPWTAVGLMARYDRVDLLLHGFTCQRWLHHQIGRVTEGAVASTDPSVSLKVRPFLTSIVVPALLGGSVEFLRSVFSEMQRRRLYKHDVWRCALCPTFSHGAPLVLVVSAATSKRAAFSLDFVCDCLAEATKLRKQAVSRHVAAVVMTLVLSGVTVSAMEWAREQSGALSLAALVQSVNADIARGTVVVLQDWLQVHAPTLTPRCVEAYEFVHRESRVGGWLRGALSEGTLRGTALRTLTALWSAKPEWNGMHTCADLKMATLATRHCLVEGASAGTPCAIVVRLIVKKLAVASVAAAHDAVHALARPPREHVRVYTAGLYDLLYGSGEVLFTVLARATALGEAGIVATMLGKGGRGLAQGLTAPQRDSVIRAAVFGDCAETTKALVEGGAFEATPGLAISATRRRRSNFMREIFARWPHLACERIGRVALETRDIAMVDVAVAAGCFRAGSTLEAHLRSGRGCVKLKRMKLQSRWLFEGGRVKSLVGRT